MDIKSIGIVGHGHFGSLLHTLLQRFAPAITVRIHSEHHATDGQTFFDLKDVAASDAVVFAVPIAAFEESLTAALPLMRQDAVIVDVSTVKVHTVEVLKRVAAGRKYIATHPVWGPESYAKHDGDVSGFRIVMTDGTLDVSDYNALTAFLKQCGFDVVEMGSEEHDKHLAETLFLTHLVGQTILHGGFGRTAADTVSFGYLMDAVESIKNDEELFRDVFRFNPYCKDVLARVSSAESEVRTLLKDTRDEKRIGISGAKGSFSEEAARSYATSAGIAEFSLDYLISVEGVLSALEKGSIDIGVFPIANSTGGVVTEAEETVGKHAFVVKKLFGIDIKQNLIAQKDARKESITRIVSHDQALKQCREYLAKNWPNAKIEAYEDTAKAAEDLASGKLPASTAVIASRTAAQIYDLQILEASIQDLKTNFTTFIVVE